MTGKECHNKLQNPCGFFSAAQSTKPSDPRPVSPERVKGENRQKQVYPGGGKCTPGGDHVETEISSLVLLCCLLQVFLDQHFQCAVGCEVFVGQDSVGHRAAVLSLLQPRTDGTAVIRVSICNRKYKYS